MTSTSLRTRLLTLIIAPLVLIACGLGYWRYQTALSTAKELFDRTILSAAIAISRDVTLSGGDALSITTRDQLRAAAGGAIFYHVAGPDLAYITGYAYPPPPPRAANRLSERPVYFDSSHQGEVVRAVRIGYVDPAPTFPGMTSVTVWQRGDDQTAFARSLALETALTLIILVAAVAAVVWFGVARGLKPLVDLEDAISTRSPDDLEGIRRPVPREVKGIVTTLNALFGQLREALSTREAFIADAAHQLRNPAASVLALAEAAGRASSEVDVRQRMDDLKVAAQRMARLTTQLLSLERLDKQATVAEFRRLDLSEIAKSCTEDAAPAILDDGLEIRFDATAPVEILGDETLIREAISNVIENARLHGPPALTKIEVGVTAADDLALVSVTDDGVGLSARDAEVALSRFGQVGQSEGSGLGLAITRKVAEVHGGGISINDTARGAAIQIGFSLPDKDGARPDRS